MKKILFIAGGTDGIGLALLNQLKSSYYKIFILGRNFNKIDSVLKIDVPIDDFVNTIGTFNKQNIKELTIDKIKEHFEINTISNIYLTNLMIPKLNKRFSQIQVCSASLAIQGRKEYSLQSSTKAAYKTYLESLRDKYKDKIKVSIIYPPSVQTNIFKKFGDNRDVSKYPTANDIASIMKSLLFLPENINIPEVLIKRF